MDKKDMMGYFNKLKNINIEEEEIISMFEGYEISKLDINRIYRYINHLTILEEDTTKFKDDYDNIIINQCQYIEE